MRVALISIAAATLLTAATFAPSRAEASIASPVLGTIPQTVNPIEKAGCYRWGRFGYRWYPWCGGGWVGRGYGWRGGYGGWRGGGWHGGGWHGGGWGWGAGGFVAGALVGSALASPYYYGYGYPYGYYPPPYYGRPCVWRRWWNGYAWVRGCV